MLRNVLLYASLPRFTPDSRFGIAYSCFPQSILLYILFATYPLLPSLLSAVYRLTIDDSRLERTNEEVCIRNQNDFIELLIRRTRKEFLRRRVFSHLLSSFEFLTIGGFVDGQRSLYVYIYNNIHTYCLAYVFELQSVRGAQSSFLFLSLPSV